MSIQYFQSIAICDTREEVDEAILAMPFVFCKDSERECFYFNSNGVRRRVEKITSVDPASPLDVVSGVLVFDDTNFASPTYVNTQIASAVTQLLGITPAELDTFQEIAAAVANLGSTDTAILSTLAGKVDKVTTVNGQPLSSNVTVTYDSLPDKPTFDNKADVSYVDDAIAAVNQVSRAPSGDAFVAEGYSTVIASDVEILTGNFYEIESNAVMAIL